MPIERVEQMPMLRVFFEKTGRARYTSHLDVMRMLTRALRRSRLPFWYTQGFNPHLYMTFALPIALGYESRCESMDVRLTEELPAEAVVERMNAVLPPGFRALGAAPPELEPGRIAWADYDVRLQVDEPAERARQLEVFLAQPTIEVTKRTKKGEKQIDIKPLTRLTGSDAAGTELRLSLRCAAGIHLNIAPTLLLGEFYRRAGFEPRLQRITRTAIRCDDGALFR